MKVFLGAAGLAAIAMVTACQTPAQSGSIAQCQRLGLKLGTPEFVHCYQQERDRRARIGMAMIRAGSAIAGSGNSTYVRRPVSVHCVRMGTAVSCSAL